MQNLQNLRNHFISAGQPYKEGEVHLFEQRIVCRGVRRATLTITALGVYEAQINGSKVGDQLFAPGYTYYPRELLYQRHDITALLAEGENVLRVLLGQGWYCGRFTHENKTQIYGENSAVSWILDIEQDDGGTLRYASTDKKVILLESPYEYAGLYDGEIYYAESSRKSDGSIPFSPISGRDPVKYHGALPEFFEETQVMTRLREEMPARSVTRKEDSCIIDFGQNFAGIIEIDPTKMNGAALKLRHGEILDKDGGLYVENLRKAKAELVYYKGTETAKYRPRFTYMGFRYAELSGVEYEQGLLTAYAIYSDMDRTGHFQCANPLAQRLYENQLWGQKSNYVEVPTDCPQRDERMGYTGDGHVFALTGSYNFETEAFWTKFLKDIRYSQMDNSEGYVAPVIPAQGPAGIGFLSMLGWGNAVAIIPEMLYWQYGKRKYLTDQYESIRLFVDCEIRKMDGNDLWIAPSLGDWLMPGKDMAWAAMHNGPVSNAFIVNDLRIAAQTAEWLGIQEDAARYAEQLEKTRNAYIAAFIEEDGRMKDDYQGAYIMALRMVLPKGELWNRVFERLAANIRANGMQTGFFSTGHILPLLADNGEAKLAYDLLLQEDCPGWMYQVKNGATTIWERWDAIRPDGTVNDVKTTDDNMVSFNHYAFGSVGAFYYQHILGIKPLSPGYEKIRVRPFVDKRLGEASGSYQSCNGLISVSWKIEGNSVEIRIETPAETEICLPDGAVRRVQAGKYEFSCNIAEQEDTADE